MTAPADFRADGQECGQQPTFLQHRARLKRPLCSLQGKFSETCVRVKPFFNHMRLHKVSCDKCRSPLFDEGRSTVLAYPSAFKFKDHKVPLDFQPTAHIFYSQRYAIQNFQISPVTDIVVTSVMDVPDGVPKWSGHKGHSELIQEMSADQGYV